MKDYKQFIKYILTPYVDSDGNETARRSAIVLYAIMALVSAVISAMNIKHNYMTMAYTTIALSIGFTLDSILCAKKKPRAAAIICGLQATGIFTYYAIVGGNYGFAILWILIMPLASMGFLGLQVGLIISIYFQILLIVLFYTPLKGVMIQHYSSTFIGRFPILYFADAAASSILMIQKHIVQLRQLDHGKELKEAVEQERNRVEAISMQTILSISNAVDAKDKYTQAHSNRVSVYACLIAEEIGWNKLQVEELRKIALLHDIGKIAVSDTILNKPGKLTDEEFAIMKRHTIAGGEILKDLTILDNVALGAKYHHERYDGKGYPNGLKGEEIPIEARIIGLADAFDAMNSNRVYRKKLTAEIIHDELVKGSGTQFDPELIKAFLPIADDLLSMQM